MDWFMMKEIWDHVAQAEDYHPLRSLFKG